MQPVSGSPADPVREGLLEDEEGSPDDWLDVSQAVALRVEIRTPHTRVLDAWAERVIVNDWAGPFQVTPGRPPFLAALTGGVMDIRRPDGLVVRLEFGFGTLASADAEVRISTSCATLHAVVESDERPPRVRPRAMAGLPPKPLLPAPNAA